jgi:hypothetical protein
MLLSAILIIGAAVPSFGAIIIQGLSSLSDLTGVNITSPSNYDILWYDSGTAQWVNSTNLTDLNNVVKGNTADIATNAGDILSLQSDVSDNAADIATNEDNISANFGNITELKNIAIVYMIDGGGEAIDTGEKGHLDIPFDCTITGWILLADQSGSIIIDVWNDSYANFPPTVADTIAGSEKPTLSSGQKNQDLSLGTWTTSVSAGDILAFNVDSVSTVTRVTLTILATRG